MPYLIKPIEKLILITINNNVVIVHRNTHKGNFLILLTNYHNTVVLNSQYTLCIEIPIII